MLVMVNWKNILFILEIKRRVLFGIEKGGIINGSTPVECPDFTRGKYKMRKTADYVEV